MPSPRKGGTTPVRRRRGKPVPRVGIKPTSPAPTCPASSFSSPGGYRRRKSSSLASADSSSSWTDTTDTSLTSSSSTSPRRSSDEYCSCSSSSSSSCSSSCSSSSGSDCSSSSSSGDGSDGSSAGSDGDDSTDDGDGGEDKARRKKRGRSCTRRGARERGGSVLCSYCGRRGYGAMRMALVCCPSARKDVKATREVASPSPPRSPLYRMLCPRQGNDPTQAVVAAPPSWSSASQPSPRYNWSPCSSTSSSSSSTLSEDTGSMFSSGEEADVEAAEDPCPSFRVPLVSCVGHVAVT